jgi:hypothetical protein
LAGSEIEKIGIRAGVNPDILGPCLRLRLPARQHQPAVSPAHRAELLLQFGKEAAGREIASQWLQGKRLTELDAREYSASE